MHFDFTDLEAFLTLSRTLNVTHAAEELRVTPSAVSLRLKRLERELDTTLFYRESRGLSLSPAGHAFERHARELLALATATEADMENYRPHHVPILRIASNNAGIQSFIVPILGPFLAKEGVRCSLLDRRSDESCRLVAFGEADLGFGLETTAKNSGLPVKILPFLRDRHVLITPPGHELARNESIRFIDTLGHPYVCLQKGAPMMRALHERARAVGVRLRPAVEVKSFDLVIRLVAGGAGVAVVPKSAVRPDAGVETVNLLDGWAVRPLAFVLPAERPPLKIAERFVERCFAAFASKSEG